MDMALHYETVDSTLRLILERLMASEVFKDFRLVGGTALSLQRGHRVSVDIDLFTDLPYGEMPTEKIGEFISSEFAYHERVEQLKERSLGYSLYIGDSKDDCIKLDLFYTDPFLFPEVRDGIIRMADEKDIAAMKMNAIVSPVKRMKDFWDIHDLLESYSLKEMIDLALRMYPYSLTEHEILEAFSHLEDVEDMSGSIKSMKRRFWDLIKLDLEIVIENR